MTTTTDRDLPKINIHAHLRTSDDLRARMKNWDDWNVVKVCALTVDPRLPWGGKGHYFDNDATLRAMREYPERVIGFGVISALRGHVDTADTVERLKSQGFTGLKICGNSFPFSHELYFPVYEKAQALGMPILFHTGFLGPVPERALERQFGITSENMRPWHLEAVLRAFPDLVVIGAHLGQPHTHEALSLLEVFPNAYFDFSGGGGGRPHVRRVLSALLPHPGLETDLANPEENRALFWFTKLLFGTDNPEPSVWVPNSEFIMDRLSIPLPLRRQFYFDTAARLLNVMP